MLLEVGHPPAQDGLTEGFGDPHTDRETVFGSFHLTLSGGSEKHRHPRMELKSPVAEATRDLVELSRHGAPQVVRRGAPRCQPKC